ncbi:hypothetical protein SEA_TARDUS_18 [Gordonia phage Tardus]|uniref:Uncharacterized protein n=1 Tax=Gordonia phage Tardus TaxID=2939734 RepID=A0A9E7E6Q5_9CAUD|nr:hypothetical protein SEA_TARDUS_18 [Gordonia phage Tardus]
MTTTQLDIPNHIHNYEYCHTCEAAIADADAREQWAAMVPAERIAIRWGSAHARLAMDRGNPRPGLATYGAALPF